MEPVAAADGVCEDLRRRVRETVPFKLERREACALAQHVGKHACLCVVKPWAAQTQPRDNRVAQDRGNRAQWYVSTKLDVRRRLDSPQLVLHALRHHDEHHSALVWNHAPRELGLRLLECTHKRWGMCGLIVPGTEPMPAIT